MRHFTFFLLVMFSVLTSLCYEISPKILVLLDSDGRINEFAIDYNFDQTMRRIDNTEESYVDSIKSEVDVNKIGKESPERNNYQYTPDEVIRITFMEDWTKPFIIHEVQIDDEELHKKILNDTISKYKLSYENELLFKESIESLYNSIGKEYDKNNEELLKDIIEYNVNDPKLKKAAQKDFEKGKVNKKLKDIITEIYDYENKLTDKRKQVYENVKKDPEGFIKKRWGKEIKKQQLTFHDTIPNPFYRESLKTNHKDIYKEWISKYYLHNEHQILPTYINKEWDWIKKDYNYDDVSQSYPISINYTKYDSHPDLRVMEGNQIHEYFIFNEEGELVGVLAEFPYFGYLDSFSIHNNNGIGKQYAVLAYEDNRYDIKSEDKKINDYIKLQLGLRKRTPQEERELDRAASAFAGAIFGQMNTEMKYGKNSRKARQEGNKNAKKAVGAISSASSGYSTEGSNWLSQIQNDAGNDFKYVENIEKVDATTFKMSYRDVNDNPTYELLVQYVQNEKPYTVTTIYTLSRRN